MATLTPPATGTQRALALAPLLASIGREIQERSTALGRLLVQREIGRGSPYGPLAGACATHRCELRRAHKELERLGCQLVSLNPRVFRVEGTERNADSALFWCTDEA
jgi:hypothetical protein